MYQELLFEIGTEEIPSYLADPAMEQLRAGFASLAEKARLEVGNICSMTTPRRMVLTSRVAKAQEETRNVAVGPALRVAFDDQGLPTKAAQGFARSKGVTVKDLVEVDTPKGRYAAVERVIPGLEAIRVLPALLRELVLGLSWPRPMRWGAGDFAFVRPVHWLVALLDGEQTPLEIAGIEAGRCTRGHRFMHGEPIEVGSVEEHQTALLAAYVILAPEARARLIEQRAGDLARAAGGRIREDREVLRANVHLCEYPVCMMGRFDSSFLELPSEVLVTAMRSHQRYFAVEDEQGRLMPAFVAVNNTPVRNDEIARQGHERVLRARLADAKFFFEEDRKKRLEEYREGLGRVVFMAEAGSMMDKSSRVELLASEIARIGWGHLVEKVGRAARLSKSDLLTHMVQEFPDLQGVIGRCYASLDGEEPEVAAAIEEHYLPRFAGDEIPASPTGVCVALADKLDTIAVCFTLGKEPTGASDSYGVRRLTLGVLRILEGFPVAGWKRLLALALSGLPDSLKGDLQSRLVAMDGFFRSRTRNRLVEDWPTDLCDAVLAARDDSPLAIRSKITALARFRKSEGFEDLATGVKRAANIIKKEDTRGLEVGPDLMSDEQERALLDAFTRIEGKVTEDLAAGRFSDALEGLSSLRGPIDDFFDHVLVMHEDPAVRSNRFALLARVVELFRSFADFRKI